MRAALYLTDLESRIDGAVGQPAGGNGFFWKVLRRQVRIEGRVALVSAPRRTPFSPAARAKPARRLGLRPLAPAGQSRQARRQVGSSGAASRRPRFRGRAFGRGFAWRRKGRVWQERPPACMIAGCLFARATAGGGERLFPDAWPRTDARTGGGPLRRRATYASVAVARC